MLHILVLAATMLLTVATSTATAGRAMPPQRPDQRLAASVRRDQQPLGIRFTQQHPVVFVANRKMYPFSFYNDNGRPDGFSVGLIKEIFSNLHIPYEIRLLSPGEAARQLLAGEAHLMIATDKPTDIGDLLREGTITLARQRLAIARLRTTQQKTALELFTRRDTITIQANGYAMRTVKELYNDTLKRPFVVKNEELSSSLQELLNGVSKYVIGSRPYLMHHVRRFGLEDVVAVDDITLPEGRYHFISTDKKLIDEMERQFMNIKTSDEYGALVDHWLSDTGEYKKPINVAYIIAIVVLLVIFLVVIFVLVMAQHGRNLSQLKREFRTINKAAQEMSGIMVVVSDQRTQWARNISGDILPPNGLSISEFEALIHPDDMSQMYKSRIAIDNGRPDSEAPFRIRLRKYDDPEGQWRNTVVTLSVRRSRSGDVRKIYFAIKDETEAVEAERRYKMRRRRIEQFTNISELAIIYFDQDGRIISTNAALRKLLASGGQGDVEAYLKDMTLADVSALLGGIHITPHVDKWFCAPIDIVELNLHTHIEVRIRSIRTSPSELIGYTVSIYNLRARRNNINNLAMERRCLNRVDKERSRYLIEAQMIMRKNKMRMFQWRKGNDYIDLTTTLTDGCRYSLISLVKAVSNLPHEELMPYILDPFKYFANQSEATLRYKWTVNGDKTVYEWLHTIPRPILDANGNIEGYEAVVINESQKYDMTQDLKVQENTVARLAEQKTTFLSNMTHELRTPLNIVSGFAEVLPYTTDEAESKMYIDVMAHHTAMLIHLSNNILNLSIIDANGVQLKQSVIDFAAYFADRAPHMDKYIAAGTAVQLQVDTPMEHLYLLLDPDKILNILEVFVTNAAKNTTAGRIRIGYRYHDDQLFLYCTDTGCGIPYEARSDIFKRFYKVNEFVLGAGLGLALADVEAKALGGTIRCFSQPGKGSVFMLILPRTAVKKQDVNFTPPPYTGS